MKKSKKIVFAGGVTGGHILPLVALAKELSFHKATQHWSVDFVASSYGFEKSILDSYALSGRYVWGKRTVQRISIWNVITGVLCIWYVFVFVIRFLIVRPVAVVGSGSFVCLPVYSAAILLRIPLFIVEPNVSYGLVNGLFVKKATKVFRFLGNNFLKNEVLVGNPVRSGLVHCAVEVCGGAVVNGRKLRVLVLGGSGGSVEINQLVARVLQENGLSECELVWQTGRSELGQYQHLENSKIRVVEYIDDIGAWYQWADVIVATASAGIIAEAALFKKALVLMPLLYSTGGHQKENANFLQNQNMALVVEQGDSIKNLSDCIDIFRDSNFRKQYANQFAVIAAGDAAEKSILHILKSINKSIKL